MANEAYIKFITDWYKQKPKTPPVYNYTEQQKQADLRSVQQQYRPYYQEQIDYSNKNYANTLNNARQSFSRRGIWGAAPTQTTGPTVHTTGTTQNTALNFSPYGGGSGIRQQAEQQLQSQQDKGITALERAYQEATAQAQLQRQNENYDVYQKTVLQPYQQQISDWQTMLGYLTAKGGY